MWQLPCPSNVRIRVPEGCHYLPGYWGDAEVSELARLIAEGSDKDEITEVRRISHQELRRLASGAAPDRDGQDHLMLIVEPPGSSNASLTCEAHAARFILQRLTADDPESGATLGFVERHLKRPVLALLRLFISGQSAQTGSAFARLPAALVDLAASMSPDPFDVMRILERTSQDAALKQTVDWDENAWRRSLSRQAGQLLGQKLNQLDPNIAPVAVELILFGDNVVGRTPSQITQATSALASLGLCRYSGSDFALGPLARAVMTVGVGVGLIESLERKRWSTTAHSEFYRLQLKHARALILAGRWTDAREQIAQLSELTQETAGDDLEAVRLFLFETPTPLPMVHAAALSEHAWLLARQGQPDIALGVLRLQVLPVFEHHKDIRAVAVTMGKIADILQDRGQLDEALRIRQEDCLPVYQKLGDIHSQAVNLGKISDIYQARGQLDEALRIRQEDCLPVFLKLDDSRSWAVTLAKIADIYQARGQLEEALRIRQEDCLPVFLKLGDIRSRAVTLGKIADIYHACGQLDEALRIRQEDCLPVFLKLDDIRSRAVTLGKIADIYQARGQLDEALHIRQEEELPVFLKLDDIRERAVTLGKIADIYQARGQMDEALRIRQEEELPVYLKLGDIRSRAMTLGKVADIYQDRGQPDEALRIHQEDCLPVYLKLGDIRSRAVTLGKIANIYHARGQLDEALHIRQEEELPVYLKLGDIRSRAMTLGKIADIYQARGQLDEALRILQEECLPVFLKLGDIRSRAVTLGKIAGIYQARGQLDDALRIRQEEELPVYLKLRARRDVLVCEASIANMLVHRKAAGDREQAVILLNKAHAEATQMKLPEAQQIESFLNELSSESPSSPFPLK